MPRVTPKMGLRVWDQLNDPYDHTQQANNWARVDYHDHTPGRGVQIPTNGLEDGAVTAEKLADVVVVASFIPVSTILAYGGPSPAQIGGSVAPDGFVFCDGSIYDGTLDQYAALGAVLGTRFGGSGISAFAVPNLCNTGVSGATGRFPLGVKSTIPQGAVGGQTTVTLDPTQIPAHTHPITDPGHSHPIRGRDGAGAADVSVTFPFLPLTDGYHNSIAGHTNGFGLPEETFTGISVNANTGGGGGHDNMPPYQAVNYIIKL